MAEKRISVLHHLRASGADVEALNFLGSILRGLTGRLQLIYVNEKFPEIKDESRRELARDQHEQYEKVGEEELMARARENLRNLGANFSVEPITSSGDPVAEVLSQLEREEYDLLSLEAFGRGGFRKNILGAHANEIVQKASLPTLVHKGELDACERVLIHVPNDRKRCTGLVSYLAELFEGAKPAITFLIILTEESEKFEGYISGEEEYLEESLENYAREEFGYLEVAEDILAESGMEAEVRYRIGEVKEEILTEAKEGRYDLLAFSPEKENILTSLWSGNQSLELIRNIDISVLRHPGSG